LVAGLYALSVACLIRLDPFVNLLTWFQVSWNYFLTGVKIVIAAFRGGFLNPARGLGERCKLPQRGLVRALAEIEFGAF